MVVVYIYSHDAKLHTVLIAQLCKMQELLGHVFFVVVDPGTNVEC